jgi:hypothetical protein
MRVIPEIVDFNDRSSILGPPDDLYILILTGYTASSPNDTGASSWESFRMKLQCTSLMVQFGLLTQSLSYGRQIAVSISAS